MKKFTLCLAAALLFPAALFAAGPMKAGKWEVTTKMEMPGMKMDMPAQTFTVCITPEQADKPVPPKMEDGDCKISDYKINGNTTSWSVSCPKKNVSGDGKMTFKGDTYEGVNHMKVGEQQMEQKYTGKRIGDCDAKAPVKK